jgi:ABC-type multidrug transport system fused ATPase/permease subunit
MSNSKMGGARALLRPHTGRLLGVLALSATAAAGEALGLAFFSVLLGGIAHVEGATPGALGGLSRFMEASPRLFFTLLGVTYIAKGVLSLVANYVSIRVSLRIADGWRMRLLQAFLHVPLRGIPPKQGIALQLVLDQPVVAAQGLAAGSVLAQNVISTAAIYVTLLWLSPSTTLVLTCVAAVVVLVLSQLFRFARQIGVQRTEVYASGYGYLTEMIGALRQLRLFGLEGRVEKQAEELFARIRKVTRGALAIASSPRLVIELVFVGVFVLILVVFMPFVSRASILASAGLAGVAALRLLPSFSAAAGIWAQVQQAIAAMNHIASELAHLEGSVEPTRADAQPLPPFREAIELRDVNFGYPGRPAVLRGVTLRIRAGEFVALVGPSGSGKSTLLELVCGLHDPDSGEVIVDGKELRTASKTAWRQHDVGVVPQDGFLMSGTVRDNLLLLRPDCPEGVLARAIAAVGADGIIAQLPSGDQTMIGERGFSLSGGQRQRLALARVLVREPRILLMDEATSALDAESDEDIFRGLERNRGTMTIIAVAHRLASIRRADRIFFLVDGQIAESGSHDELLALNGAYAALYRTSQRSSRNLEAEPGRGSAAASPATES